MYCRAIQTGFRATVRTEQCGATATAEQLRRGVRRCLRFQKKGYTYCHCALPPRWGLRELWKSVDSKYFWGLAGGGIQFRGNVKEQLLKHCEIIKVYKTPNQLLAEGNLLPGRYLHMGRISAYKMSMQAMGSGMIQEEAGRSAAIRTVHSYLGLLDRQRL